MDREEVYAVINGERDFQDFFFSRCKNKRNPNVGEEILIAEEYLKLAREKHVRTKGDEASLHELRKVSGILVRCFEHHGVPERK